MNPLSAAEVQLYAGALRGLLRSLDKQIVEAALMGDADDYLWYFVSEVVEELRLVGCRSASLALLDSFERAVREAQRFVDALPDENLGPLKP